MVTGIQRNLFATSKQTPPPLEGLSCLKTVYILKGSTSELEIVGENQLSDIATRSGLVESVKAENSCNLLHKLLALIKRQEKRDELRNKSD